MDEVSFAFPIDCEPQRKARSMGEKEAAGFSRSLLVKLGRNDEGQWEIDCLNVLVLCFIGHSGLFATRRVTPGKLGNEGWTRWEDLNLHLPDVRRGVQALLTSHRALCPLSYTAKP